MRRAALSLAASALAMLPAAATAGGGGLESAEDPSPRAVEAGTRFGFDLYREIAKDASGRNVFISPTSVALALSMAANGAAGATRDAMLGGLRLTGLPVDDVNRSAAALLHGLQEADAKVRLRIANSIWGRKGVVFGKAFLDLNRTFFGAEVSDLDFSDPSSPGVINAWVKEKTEGRIPAMVDRIDPQAVLFILNAIYFKGTWTKEFDKKDTRERLFHLPGGPTANVPMMSRHGKFLHLETKGFEAVRLPYGEGRFAMYLFLPASEGGLDALHRALAIDAWKEWMVEFREAEGSVTLPRFKMEYETALKAPLSSMGMAAAFDPQRADFTPMTGSKEAFLHEVKHKTFVEVNEEGTEAAAATSVEIRVTSALISRPFNLVFDRPFFCAIRDDRTGAVIFLGSINDPR